MRIVLQGEGKRRGMIGDEKGQTLIEYAFVLLLIAVVVIAMVTGVGQNTNNMYSKVNASIPSP